MRIVLADNQQQRAEEIRRILLGEGLMCDAGDVVTYEGLAGRLAGSKADLVLVTCNGVRGGCSRGDPHGPRGDRSAGAGGLVPRRRST